MLLRRTSFLLLILAAGLSLHAADEKRAVPFKDGDRVAWIGSSSTKIGVWPKTIEFLLRTRHPETKLAFSRHTTGGGSFDTGLKNLTKWLDEGKPTFVLYNYGGNDAGAGEAGLPKFYDNMEKCVEQAKAAGARVVVMTHQSSDVKKSGEAPAAKRKLYAEKMIERCIEKKIPIIDTHHAIEKLQQDGVKEDPAYTILKDTIHLTEPAYIGWGYYLYERITPPPAESAAEISATGQPGATTKCKLSEIKNEGGVLSFTRADEILPLLPPVALPPRKLVPLEKFSRYMLKVGGLAEGSYAITCEGKPVGTASAKALAEGVNLNTVLLDSANPAPWEALAKELWNGKSLEQIGQTKWKFEVKKQ